VRLVLHSDLHADANTLGVPRHRDAREALAQVRAAAEGADYVFFLGDAADPDHPIPALRAAALLTEHACEVGDEAYDRFLVAIPGNHDVFEDGSGESTIECLRHLPGVRLFSAPAAKCLNNGRALLNVVALPFTPTSHPYDPAAFVDGVELDPSIPTVVVGHLVIHGVQKGEETNEMPRGREVLFPLEAVGRLVQRMKAPVFVANGHYHRQQVFETGHGYAIHIPGATARLTAGEERHEPGFLVVDL
jgi:DNA repair exonuclease SbcCD nuclease subunit